MPVFLDDSGINVKINMDGHMVNVTSQEDIEKAMAESFVANFASRLLRAQIAANEEFRKQHPHVYQ